MAPETSTAPQWKITENDRRVLRELGKRHVELSHDPRNVERREQWYLHNDLQPSRPLVIIESFPATDEYVTDADLQCTEPWARGVEKALRTRHCHFEKIDDDEVIEPWFNVNWRVATSGYGVNVERHYSAQNKGTGPACKGLSCGRRPSRTSTVTSRS